MGVFGKGKVGRRLMDGRRGGVEWLGSQDSLSPFGPLHGVQIPSDAEAVKRRVWLTILGFDFSLLEAGVSGGVVE